MKPMRLKAVLRETWRNVATGTSRCALISLLLSICAVACMCADLTQMTGLIGDARKWEESGASTYAITLQGGIDGAACEGLRSASGVLGAAALRQSSDRVRIASLPATEIPTYEASAHVAQVFAATGIRKDNSGVIMSTAVARTYGAHAGTVLPLVGGTRMRVSATFNWPSDGRQPTYGYAIISPGNDTKAYDTCLVRAWPGRARSPPVSKPGGVPPSAPMPNPVSAPLRAPPLPGRVEATKRRMRKSAGSIPCWGRICLARRISMPASPGMRHC